MRSETVYVVDFSRSHLAAAAGAPTSVYLVSDVVFIMLLMCEH